MPTKCKPQKLAGKKKLQAASARETRAQLAAKADASREIRPDRLMEASKTAEDGSQIQPEQGPSRGRGGHAEVGAQTGAKRVAGTAHLVSDDQESKDALGVVPSKGLTTSPTKKGRFDQKEPDGDTDSDRSRSGGSNRQPQVSCTFRLLYRRLIWRMLVGVVMMMRDTTSD
jgi:hypothetical protein